VGSSEDVPKSPMSDHQTTYLPRKEGETHTTGIHFTENGASVPGRRRFDHPFCWAPFLYWKKEGGAPRLAATFAKIVLSLTVLKGRLSGTAVRTVRLPSALRREGGVTLLFPERKGKGRHDLKQHNVRWFRNWCFARTTPCRGRKKKKK